MNHTQNNLYLYVKNTGQLYPKIQRVQQLLVKATPQERAKIGKGLFRRVVQDGEAMMQREFARNPADERPQRASAADISRVAAELLSEFEAEHKLGNMQQSAPKIYMGRQVK